MHILAHDIRNYTCAESHMDNKYTELVCRNICEQIQKIFNHLWNKNQVSVCIKRIVAGKNTNANYREWKTETIAGNYSDHNRYNLDDKKTPITNDSDFFIIVSPDHIDSIFSCSDLTKVEEEFLKKYGMKYEKFPTNYLEFYKSTIVAPIRIKSSNVNPSLRNNNMGNYHLVGFLCIDTKEVFSEDEILFEIGVELTKTFADMLYKLLENNIVYYVNKKGKNNP